ncbi:MAG: cyclic nucleotide-binding domain-containing protein, partial [Pseudomonadota bacterium]
MTSDHSLYASEISDSGSEDDHDWCSALDAFAELDRDQLRLFGDAQDCVSYAAGDSVVASGQHDGTLLYGIAKGIARIVRPAVQVGDFDVREAAEGDVIGLAECLSFREPMPGSMAVTALTNLDVVLLDREIFLATVTGN